VHQQIKGKKLNKYIASGENKDHKATV